MGSCSSNLQDQPHHIFVFGVRGSGKTSILYSLKTNEAINTHPTRGFNVEIINMKQRQFNLFDVSEPSHHRAFWSKFLQQADGVVFVLDSTEPLSKKKPLTNLDSPHRHLSGSDLKHSYSLSSAHNFSDSSFHNQIPDSDEESPEQSETKSEESALDLMKWIVQEEIPASLPVLILANKQDDPKATSPRLLFEKLREFSKRQHFYVQGCSARTGQGLAEGFDWLTQQIVTRFPKASCGWGGKPHYEIANAEQMNEPECESATLEESILKAQQRNSLSRLHEQGSKRNMVVS